MEGDDKARQKAIEDMKSFLELLFEVDKEAVASKFHNDGGFMMQVKHGNFTFCK